MSVHSFSNTEDHSICCVIFIVREQYVMIVSMDSIVRPISKLLMLVTSVKVV